MNLGPGDVTIHSAIVRYYKEKWWKNWRAFFNRHYRRQYGMLNPLEAFPDRLDYTKGPFSGGLPKKIATEESFGSYFHRHMDWLHNRGLRIGVSDGFGRNHWCAKGDVKKVSAATRDQDVDTHANSI
jgi:hypothetical protein